MVWLLDLCSFNNFFVVIVDVGAACCCSVSHVKHGHAMWIDAGISLQFYDYGHGFNRIIGNLHIHKINDTNGQPFIMFLCFFANSIDGAGCVVLLQFTSVYFNSFRPKSREWRMTNVSCKKKRRSVTYPENVWCD